MENNQHQSSEIIQPVAQLQITPESVTFLTTAAKWAKYLAIIGFVTAGFMVLGGGAFSVFYATLGREPGNTGPMSLFTPSMLGAMYVVIALIYIWPVIYLNKFSNQTTRAIRTVDTKQLTRAFRNLKRLFQYIGIITIVVLIIYFIVIIALVVAGTMFL
jgi:hypothetical protein